MPELGRFLEISIPATDVQESLAYYRQLGFTELPVGDIRPYHYAVVTDGAVCIGLHGAGIDRLSLSFVQPGVADQARMFRESGIAAAFERLDAEEFNEAGFADSDGHLAIMLEARTFSSSPVDNLLLPVTGRMTAISLTCSQLERSLEFWESVGFELVDAGPGRVVRVRVPGLDMKLCENRRRRSPVLNFRPASHDRCLAELELRGIDAAPGTTGHVLTTPEKTELALDDQA